MITVETVAQGSLYRQGKFQLQQCRQNQPFLGGNWGASNNRGNFSNWRSNSQGSNANKNKQIYVFCKIWNHQQEDCWKRITGNKPCLDMSRGPSGPRSMWQTAPSCRMSPQSRLSRIFDSELDGTPTSSSICHSTDNYKFVCCLNCNL